MKAIIPVAGFGTRFLPATKTQPKEMLPLIDTPVIQFIVEEIVDSGIKNIIFVTSKYKKGLEDYFDSHNELERALMKKGKNDALKELRRIERLAKFSYVRQQRPRGNGDAILSAAHLVGKEPVLVAFGDDVYFSKERVSQKLVELYHEFGAPVCSIKKVPKDDVSKYGIVKVTKVRPHVYRVTDIVEKPSKKTAPSQFAVIGRYVVPPQVMQYLKQAKPRRRGGEIGITDALHMHLANGGEFYAYEFNEGHHFDCGSKINFLKAMVHLGLTRKEFQHEFKQYIRSLKL